MRHAALGVADDPDAVPGLLQFADDLDRIGDRDRPQAELLMCLPERVDDRRLVVRGDPDMAENEVEIVAPHVADTRTVGDRFVHVYTSDRLVA